MARKKAAPIVALAPAVSAPPPVPQIERTRILHDRLADVVNSSRETPETVLMALELLKYQALAPRLKQATEA